MFWLLNKGHTMTTMLAESKEPKAQKQLTDQQMVNEKYPEISGFTRKIFMLFKHGNSVYYRINYFETEKQNYITKSYFIEVTKDGIVTEDGSPNENN